ncbi:RagB/SusD family nutrient uptake outer membrane protein [Flavihumibacter petaseus]|nr:RagB/SusD family nutrient uptake outer membrane protein [Flavihumibacter petaseus]
MNKNIIYGAALSILVAAGTGCSKDFLEQENQNELSGASFWKTKEQALQAITATYAALQAADGSKWTWFEETYVASEYKTDEMINNKAEGYGKRLQTFTYSTDESSFTNLWHMCFAGINRANQCIENIPNVSSNAQTGLSDEEKASLIAEAKFLRAHFYLLLQSYFTNIPLITATVKNNAEYYPAPATEADIWAQIEADLKDGVAHLPEEYLSPEELGRVTRYTAQAYLGKTYLFQEKFTEASAAFQEVISSGKYHLLPKYEDNFNGLSENGPESLFEIQFSADRTNDNDERTPMAWEVSSYALNGWELFYPSDWLATELKTDKRTDGGYSDRVYGTMFFDDPLSVAPVVDQPDVYRTYAEVKDDLNHPVFFKKYTTPTDLADNHNYTGININLMRYADVLLMQAESLNESGLTEDALALVNEVRERSKAAPLGQMSKDALRLQIRHHERPCELAMEYSIRWSDLYRWSRGKVAPEKIKAVMTGHQQEFANNFIDGKHDIYPVPLSEISKNPNSRQAQNW